jgi:hypothetical protein
MTEDDLIKVENAIKYSDVTKSRMRRGSWVIASLSSHTRIFKILTVAMKKMEIKRHGLKRGSRGIISITNLIKFYSAILEFSHACRHKSQEKTVIMHAQRII